MPEKQIVTKIKEEKEFFDVDAAEEYAEKTRKRKINSIVMNSSHSTSEWQVTEIKKEKDGSSAVSDVDTEIKKERDGSSAVSDEDTVAKIAENEEINPIVFFYRYGWNEGQTVIDGKKKKKNIVIPNYQLYIKCTPPVLASEIKELHPDIVSVKALRQKGKYFVTFPNKMASSKALEDLRKADLKGHKLRVSEYRVHKDCDVPFMFGRSTPKKE